MISFADEGGSNAPPDLESFGSYIIEATKINDVWYQQAWIEIEESFKISPIAVVFKTRSFIERCEIYVHGYMRGLYMATDNKEKYMNLLTGYINWIQNLDQAVSKVRKLENYNKESIPVIKKAFEVSCQYAKNLE